MWDVVWTDPGRELVGERRARRDLVESSNGGGVGGRASLSSSTTTTSSRSSLKAESAFARFRARGLKQQQQQQGSRGGGGGGGVGATNSKQQPSSPLPSPASAFASTVSARSSVSAVVADGKAVPEEEEEEAKEKEKEKSVMVVSSKDVRHDTSSESTRSRFARIISSPATSTSSSRFFDRRSPARSVFAEPLTPPRSPTVECASPVVGSIADEGRRQEQQQRRRRRNSSHRQHPDLPASPPCYPLADKARPCSSSHQWGSAPAEPEPEPEPQVIISSSDSRWNSTTTSSSSRRNSTRRSRSRSRSIMSRESASSMASEIRHFWTPSDRDAFIQEINSMATAPPTVALAKLKELTAASEELPPQQQQAQQQDFNQLEVDRLRWMFSVLLHLDVPTPRSGSGGGKRRSRLDPANVQNILALYESKASASYLAGLYHNKRILHLSDKPLPHDALQNVQSLKATDMAPSAFPIPPQLFEAVYAVSLPSLCSSQELRGLIKSVRACLKPNGTLSLRLIDPLPCAETLGRRMRSWLEEHLIANLEKQGRCSRPTAQLPQWLGEESLRAPGSTLTTAKFYATAESVRRLAKDPDPAIERMHAERKVKAELRSLVGRMLWREVWGEYVTAERWWWEEEACVEECLELGTFWEYHLIEAVKDG
ncbi:hypothetical protein CP532_0678 [Ophiocordyceps camponoti-leonardi (nom. inval.)]|nr:hypothetical protein CP532_0678 [Ophiocordyceps camponoti-leonardi (nom. inval.)]